MPSLSDFNIDLEELLPLSGPFALNSCGNPDCKACGIEPNEPPVRLSNIGRPKKRCETARALLEWQANRPGVYALSGTDRQHDRVTTAFDHSETPFAWCDQRRMTCKARLRDGTICNSNFAILSDHHLLGEVDRLRNMNGVLDGPACGACGKRYLAAPEEFSMNGAHQRTDKSKTSAPKAIRVIHKPCKGRRGARFSISIPHARQKTTKDNIRVLHALVNSAGINDVRRLLGADATGKKIGVARIYDRIAWFEQVFLAYEREMLRRWRKRVEASRKTAIHRLSHDDLVLSVNWEAATTRATTQLNCTITADAHSGYVYRVDVDFDPTVSPIEEFRKSYLDENGVPRGIGWEPARSNGKQVPLFTWQRPTGRFHEPQFFAACENELKAFITRARRNLEPGDPMLADLEARVAHELDLVRVIGTGWFGFETNTEECGGSFRGMTTRDIYTKGAHFALLRELLPTGKIILTTEQEGTLPAVIPHIFRDEIQENRFVWLLMAFNKTAKKQEIISKVKGYRTAWRKFHEAGLYSGQFDMRTSTEAVTKAFIAERMQTALRPGGKTARPFQVSNYARRSFPQLWVHAPTQASGEIDKTVGFAIPEVWLRHRLKQLRFDVDVQTLDQDTKEELADHVYNATLQPVSAFMNAVRERLGATLRVSGGARVAGSYIQGAMFNPRTLIALLNIFRVHYNFFELRPYVAIHNEETEVRAGAGHSRRVMRYPGTDEVVALPLQAKRRAIKKTPAMRHGIDTARRTAEGTYKAPNLYRVLYRPWLYAGTPVGKRFERPRGKG